MPISLAFLRRASFSTVSATLSIAFLPCSGNAEIASLINCSKLFFFILALTLSSDKRIFLFPYSLSRLFIWEMGSVPHHFFSECFQFLLDIIESLLYVV